jgi:non-canonical poly(A) RNA polymerase PAPD5/7
MTWLRSSARASKHLRESDFGPTSAENSEDYIAFDFDDEADTKGGKEQDSSPKEQPRKRNTPKNERQREDEQWKNYIRDNKARPWAKDFRYRKARNIGERLNMEMNDLVEYLSPTEEEHTMRRFAVHRIRQCAQSLYSSCRIEVFGSFETRLYLPTSDIDLVMWYNGSDAQGSHGISKVLSKLADGLRKQGIAYSVQLILKAKVPIIKFEETFTGYQIDISLNTGNGIQSAIFIKEMLVQAPALGPLTLIFKHWLGLQKLNEVFTGGLGSYAVVLMVMSCLQTHPKVDMSDTLNNLGVLFVDLLELYGQHFNIFHVGIDVANRNYYRKVRNVDVVKGDSSYGWLTA